MLLLFKFILFVRLNNTLGGSDILLFTTFINILSFLYYDCIEFIVLLHSFLVILFSYYTESIVLWVSFSKFPVVLTAFTCERAVHSLWNICLGVNILRFLHFCCFLNSKIFSAVSIPLRDFHFLLLTTLFQTISASLTWYTVCSLFGSLSFYNFFAKNDEWW